MRCSCVRRFHACRKRGVDVREAQIGSAQRDLLQGMSGRRRARTRDGGAVRIGFCRDTRTEGTGLVLLEEERLELEKERSRRVKVSDKNSGVYEEGVSRLKLAHLGRVSMYEGLV
jgi:hypothetical protein